MIARSFLFIVVAISLLFCLPISGVAEGKKAEVKKELPQSGSLSSSRIGGGEGVAVEGAWGGVEPFAAEKNPITGSVSRRNVRDWIMKVFNNSEDTYRVTVAVVQLDKGNKKLKSNTYSYTLKGGESKEREFTARPGTEQCALELKNWKNLTPPKPEGQEEGAATPAAG